MDQVKSSYACCAGVFKRVVQQVQSQEMELDIPFHVVRNSYPHAQNNNDKNLAELFPENVWGGNWSPPIKHHLKLPARGDACIDCSYFFD